MKLLNSMTMGNGGGQIAKLQLPSQFQKGFKCSRIRLRATCTLNSGGAYTLTLADITALFTYIFANLTLKFGIQNYEMVDDALPFSVARVMYVAASLRDFLFAVNAGAVMQQLNAYTTGGPQAVIFAGAGNKTVNLEYVRSFTWERLSERLHDWCPGYTQMRNIQLEVLSGATPFSANSGGVTISGNITLLVIADTVPDDQDSWARVFRAFRNSISGLTQQGPAGGLLALFEMSNPALSTALTDVAIRRGTEDESIHDIVPAAAIVAEQQSILPLGSFDPNALATCLFVADDQLSGEEIPTSNYVEFFQPNNDIANPATVWIHIPVSDQNYVDSTVGGAATGPYGPPDGAGRAILSSGYTVAGKGAQTKDHLQSIAPIAIQTPSSPTYGLAPGRFLTQGAAPTDYIPQHLATGAAQVGASATASGGAQAGANATSTALRRISSAIPGKASPVRGAVTQAQLSTAAKAAAMTGGTKKAAGAVTALVQTAKR